MNAYLDMCVLCVHTPVTWKPEYDFNLGPRVCIQLLLHTKSSLIPSKHFVEIKMDSRKWLKNSKQREYIKGDENTNDSNLNSILPTYIKLPTA